MPAHAHGKKLEIWWQDEARIGQQGTLTRIWVPRGSRPRAPKDRRFTWVYLFGAVCPERGTGAALVLPTVNIDAMNKHLEEISRNVAKDAHCLLQIDGAGWHGPSDQLRVPDNIALLKLPPYTPKLNPVENIWDYLRNNDFVHQVWQTYEAIIDACCHAWNRLIQAPDLVQSIAHRSWATCVNV